MTACLAQPNVTAMSNVCLSAFMSRVAACSAEIRAFQACAGGGAVNTPHASICVPRGGPTPVGCAQVMACADRRFYTLICRTTKVGQSDCTCSEHAFSREFTLDTSSPRAYEDNFARCIAYAAESGTPPG